MGLLVNHLRPDGLPLVSDWSVQAQLAEKSGRDDQNKVVSIEEAKRAFFSKEVLFLDARPSEVYNAGHIKGARSMPAEQAEEFFEKVMGNVPKNVMIITYCDGESCALSKDLALYLFFRGYDDVRVLVNGWTRWVEAGLPIAESADKMTEIGEKQKNG